MNNVHIGGIMSNKAVISCDEIKENTKSIIADIGFDNLSMRIVAEKCGVALGTLYRYYKDKATLLFAIASDFWKECFIELHSNPSNNLFDRLRYDFNHIHKYLQEFKRDYIEGFYMAGLTKSKHGTGEMDSYIGRILLRIKSIILDSYDELDNAIIDRLGIDYITQFIFNNIKSMLMSGESNYDQLGMILKKLLQKSNS